MFLRVIYVRRQQNFPLSFLGNPIVSVSFQRLNFSGFVQLLFESAHQYLLDPPSFRPKCIAK